MLIFLQALTLKREGVIIVMSEGENQSSPHRPSSAHIGQERRKPMKKFIVIVRRPAIFNRKQSPIYAEREEFTHAVDAHRYAQAMRERKARETAEGSRWAVISVEVTFE